jgi:hypothetical protein
MTQQSETAYSLDYHCLLRLNLVIFPALWEEFYLRRALAPERALTVVLGLRSRDLGTLLRSREGVAVRRWPSG